MGDNTGAPWNIPYVEPSDLVRDYPAADEAQALAIAAGLSAAGGLKQVVTTVKSDTFSTTSTSFVDVTGLSATITPASLSSRILVLVHCMVSSSGGTGRQLLTLTDTANAILVSPTSPSNRSSVYAFDRQFGNEAGQPMSFSFVHSPNTTSPFVYKVRMLVSAETGFVNRTGADADNATTGRSISTITLLEVAV